MTELSQLVMTVAIGAGVPAIIAILWRISTRIEVLALRVEQLETKYQERHT